MAKDLYIREFLNHPKFHAGAHVIVELSGEDGSGHVSIADCRRSIDLSIDVDYSYSRTEGHRDNSIHKLKTLRNALNRAIRHLEKTRY